MLARTLSDKRIDPACPPTLVAKVRLTLAAGLSGKGIYDGDVLENMVVRHCPGIYAMVEADGFALRFDMVENSHRALRKGRLYFVIRRKTAH